MFMINQKNNARMKIQKLNMNKKNENNNKEIKEDSKLDIQNKEVNIDTKAKIVKGDLYTRIDMEIKTEIKDK